MQNFRPKFGNRNDVLNSYSRRSPWSPQMPVLSATIKRLGFHAMNLMSCKKVELEEASLAAEKQESEQEVRIESLKHDKEQQKSRRMVSVPCPWH